MENNFRKPRSDLGLDRVNPALDSAPARITAPNGTAVISAAVGPASSRGVHGNGEDWDPMGPMGFPWEWE